MKKSRCNILMLVRFTVKNFCSFAEEATFSMIPGKSRLHRHHVVLGARPKDISVLKIGTLYGSNASGKSNLVKAMEFARNLILQGTRKAGVKIDFQTFRLDDALADQPTRIEFEINHKGRTYAYGFEVTQHEVLEEWLFEVDKTSEKIIFERQKYDEGKHNYKIGIKTVGETEAQFLKFTQAATRNNQLFITEFRERNLSMNLSGSEPIYTVLDWFENVLTIINPNTRYNTGLVFEWKNNDQIESTFHEFLQYFNTGVSGVDFEDNPLDQVIKLPNGMPGADIKQRLIDDISKKLDEGNASILLSNSAGKTYGLSKDADGGLITSTMIALHRKRNSDLTERFELEDESDGTQRIMDLIPVLMDLFKGDKVFVIDELDRSLHPNLTYDFIDLFLEKSIGKASQLIVTTHESRLLSQKLLRKDEIWFVYKQPDGASKLYSLEDFNIRFDKDIRNDYLLGRYQAVPRFGNRNQLSSLA